MSMDDSDHPNGEPLGMVPLMSAPPTFNPLLGVGLPPPNPGRGSGSTRVRLFFAVAVVQVLKFKYSTFSGMLARVVSASLLS